MESYTIYTYGELTQILMYDTINFKKSNEGHGFFLGRGPSYLWTLTMLEGSLL